MSVKLLDIVKYCDNYLESDKFEDYGPNGLQVEGNHTVKKIVTGVSACGELFKKAAECSADLVLVHHGMIGDESKTITGIYKDRIKTLLDNNISLVAYHLPLDAHPVSGNNALIADQIGLSNREMFIEYKGNNIGVKGAIDEVEFNEFLKIVAEKISSVSFFVNGGKKVKNIGIISGGARGDIEKVFEEGVDTYITGEIGEPTKAFCEEAGMNYIALGHYSSEVWGVKALGKLISKEFGIECEFVGVNNPY